FRAESVLELPSHSIFNHQLIPHLGAALEAAMRRKLQHAFRAKIRPGNLERPNHLPQTDNFEVLIDQNQVKREKHADGVNRIGGANPYPTVRRKRSPAQQADQPAEDRVGDLNPKGKKSFLRLVVHKYVAISLSHECLLQWVLKLCLSGFRYRGAFFFIL